MPFARHFKAVFKRRALIAKRSKCSMVSFSVMSLFCSVIILICIPLIYLQTMDDQTKNYTFENIHKFNLSVAVVGKPDERVNEILTSMIETELSVKPQFYHFGSKEEMDNFVIHEQESSVIRSSLNMVYGYEINGTVESGLSIMFFYNASHVGDDTSQMKHDFGLYTTLEVLRQYDPSIKTYIPHFVEVDYISRSNGYLHELHGYMYPIGILILSCLFVIHVAFDVNTDIRPYMIAFGLNKVAYWTANMMFDLIFYYSICLVSWCLRIGIVKNTPVQKVADAFAMWLSGPAIVLSSYIFCFLSQRRFVVLIVYVVFFSLMMICTGMLRFASPIFYPKPGGNDSAMAWVAWMHPFSGLMMTMTSVEDETHIKIPRLLAKSIVMPVVDFVLYGLLLVIIDLGFPAIRRKGRKLQFSMWADQCMEVKRRQPVTEEAIAMEQMVADAPPGQFAVKINNVSKVFKDTKGNPVFAVNHLSLGIEPGTMFGFLGANGAGKTTLLNMIIGKEDVSDGSIEIDGHNVANGMDPRILTVCPQFDRHLTPDMTGREQLVFYAEICGVENPVEKVNEMIDKVDYRMHCDKLLKEMSGGNQRKCSVLIPFLSSSSIILLDEPTASLDPLARHRVHEMIQEHRGRTYMLCTHLLDEAEALCDKVSIMIHGCVYAIGSPEELANKFGSDFKIDVLLNDDSTELKNRVHEFIMSRIPTAKNPIDRLNSRMYTVPSRDITLLDLFNVLDECMSRGVGLKSYTCSSSTLERVFLEIILLSTKANGEEQQPDATFAPV